MKRLLSVWVVLCIALPVVFGLFMLVGAEATIRSTGAHGLLNMLVIRQLVYSAVLLAAWLRLGPVAAGVLVLGRGATDLLDGVAMIAGSGHVTGPELFPIVSAAISFAVGMLLLRRSPAPAPA